jgi:hypothetical protein
VTNDGCRVEIALCCILDTKLAKPLFAQRALGAIDQDVGALLAATVIAAQSAMRDAIIHFLHPSFTVLWKTE